MIEISWPLSSEGSLARNSHCDTGHLQEPVTLKHIVERLAVELSLMFLIVRSVFANKDFDIYVQTYRTNCMFRNHRGFFLCCEVICGLNLKAV